MNINKIKSTVIANKIKDYMKNVSVDVFGYEEKITTNITKYIKRWSVDSNTPVSKITIFIRNNIGIQILLCRNNEVDKYADTYELIEILFGKETTPSRELQFKIEQSITNYLKDLAEEHNLPKNAFYIAISRASMEVIIRIYNRRDFIKAITIGELVKHFIG